MGVAAFWTEPTERERRWLRRYTSSGGGWTCAEGWHQAMAPIEDGPAEGIRDDAWPHDDPRWPAVCEKGCGYVFVDGDRWQLFSSRLYRRPDTGESFPLREMPPGAMYDASWMHESGSGIYLVVILPSPNRHPWMVDGQASNCTRRCPWYDEDSRARYPQHATEPMGYGRNGWGDNTGQWATTIAPHDDARCDPTFSEHKCWVRHGDPRTGQVTVDKSGATCQAGAGSIGADSWHGFLRDGQLVP